MSVVTDHSMESDGDPDNDDDEDQQDNTNEESDKEDPVFCLCHCTGIHGIKVHDSGMQTDCLGGKAVKDKERRRLKVSQMQMQLVGLRL